MLVHFSIKNYKTFRESVVLSFVASSYDKDVGEESNVSFNEKYGLNLLKTAVIYGANASGKSKLHEALYFMRRFVIESSKNTQDGDEIDVQPFILNAVAETEASEFEVSFIFKEVLYRYGFEVTRAKVVSEWLYYRPKTREIELFYRDKGAFEIHERGFSKAKAVIKAGLLRENALLVSVAAQFNDEVSKHVLEWFKSLQVLSALNESEGREHSIRKLKNPVQKSKILELLRAADFGIQDVMLQEMHERKLSLENQNENSDFLADVLTAYNKYDKAGDRSGFASFSLDKEESSGTKQYFILLGPILEALENGSTLVMDELTSMLHPNLVCRIVTLFQSKELNLNNAQLVFNTHNTSLLSTGLFRRDQVWFVDKNKYGEAKLYSLSDFKSNQVNTDKNLEKNYIRGRYAAIPFLDFFDALEAVFSQYQTQDKD